VLLVGGFAYMRLVRDHAQRQSLGQAIETSVRTDPLTVLGGDFKEVDHFVVLRRLVPDGLPRLDGRSLWDVPASFVPRRLWGDKPLPVDFTLAHAVHGEDHDSGNPFTLAGELWWNHGVAGVLVGMTLLGAAGGLGWRALYGRPAGAGAVAGALVVGYSYLLFTRPLGPMLLTSAMALVALLVVATLAAVLERRRAGGGPGRTGAS
jgi:hypothetical protein